MSYTPEIFAYRNPKHHEALVLPLGSSKVTVSDTRVYNTVFAGSSSTAIDLVIPKQSGFLDPSTLAIRALITLTDATLAQVVAGCPSFSYISQVQSAVGSSVLKIVPYHGVVSTALLNLCMSKSQKSGKAIALGFAATSSDDNLTDARIKAVAGGTETFSVVTPLLTSVIANASGMIPLSCGDIRFTIYLADTTQFNAFSTATGSSYSVKNLDLVYDVFKWGDSRDNYIPMSQDNYLPPVVSLKTLSYNVATSTYSSGTSGTSTLSFSINLKSVRGLLALFVPRNLATATTGSTNNVYDSWDVTNGTGTYQFALNNVFYPQVPINALNLASCNWELQKLATIFKNNFTSLFDKSSDMSISVKEASYSVSALGTTGTTSTDPSKFMVGCLLDKLYNQGDFYTGVPTINNNIQLKITSTYATTQDFTCILLAVGDCFLNMNMDQGNATLSE